MEIVVDVTFELSHKPSEEHLSISNFSGGALRFTLDEVEDNNDVIRQVTKGLAARYPDKEIKILRLSGDYVLDSGK